eukprot:1862270-Rhodomonas_salina.2
MINGRSLTKLALPRVPGYPVLVFSNATAGWLGNTSQTVLALLAVPSPQLILILVIALPAVVRTRVGIPSISYPGKV